MTRPNAEAVAFATVLLNYLDANAPVDALPMKNGDRTIFN
jgi:hypothetical protein